MKLKLSDGVSVAALAVSVVAFLVSYASVRDHDILAIRPILVFEYQESGWKIENVGSAPAMDVVFTRISGGEVYDNIRLPALAKDAALDIRFARHDNQHEFAATYRDIEGRPYTSRSVNDVSTTHKGFDLPGSREKNLVPWWRLPDSDT